MSDVLIVGDSLTVQCADHLFEMADAVGADVVIDAENGRSITRAKIILRHRAEADSVVIALGTNDIGWAPVTVEGWIDDTLAECPPEATVWWVDIGVAGDRGSDVNAALAAACERHPRLRILHWSEIVSEDPGVLDPDGIHLTETGIRRWAEMTAKATFRAPS